MLKPLFSCAITSLYATAAHADTIRIVTDIPPVQSLVTQVLGTSDGITLLVDGASSPHDFALKPSQASDLEKADMVVFIGHALTPWIEKPVETLAANAVHLELLDLEKTEKLGFRDLEDFDGGEDDHDDHDDKHDDHDEDKHDDHDDKHDDHDDHASEKDDHGHGHNHEGDVDPHAWLDSDNGIVWLDAIAASLSQMDPDNAAQYKSNAKAAQDRLKLVADELEEQLEPVENKPFVMLHDAFQYFEEKFHLHASGTITLADDSQPTPSQLQHTKEVFASKDIECIFVEPQVSTKLLKSVDALGVKQQTLDPLGRDIAKGADFYETLLRNTAASFAKCLG